MKMNLHDIETHIGKQLKLLRLANKVSQRDLANKMGVTYQQVQKYENGLNKISVSRLWQVCEIFKISPNVLFENILSNTSDVKNADSLIPNKLATSQDMKMIIAFKKIEKSSSRALLIKLCQEMASNSNANE